VTKMVRHSSGWPGPIVGTVRARRAALVAPGTRRARDGRAVRQAGR
jgi:hypothetical protein